MAFSQEPGTFGTVRRVSGALVEKLTSSCSQDLEYCTQKIAATGNGGRTLGKEEPEKRSPNSVGLTLWLPPLNSTCINRLRTAQLKTKI